MNDKSIIKTYMIISCIVACVMVIGITAAAIYFDKASILWFYIIPTLKTTFYNSKE